MSNAHYERSSEAPLDQIYFNPNAPGDSTARSDTSLDRIYNLSELVADTADLFIAKKNDRAPDTVHNTFVFNSPDQLSAAWLPETITDCLYSRSLTGITATMYGEPRDRYGFGIQFDLSDGSKISTDRSHQQKPPRSDFFLPSNESEQQAIPLLPENELWICLTSLTSSQPMDGHDTPASCDPHKPAYGDLLAAALVGRANGHLHQAYHRLEGEDKFDALGGYLEYGTADETLTDATIGRTTLSHKAILRSGELVESSKEVVAETTFVDGLQVLFYEERNQEQRKQFTPDLSDILATRSFVDSQLNKISSQPDIQYGLRGERLNL